MAPPREKRTQAARTNDLGALEKAVNEAAGKAGGLWLSFVTFATLVLITTGTATHKHLLLELPLKLPVLNVDLPLISYFVFAPLIFLVFHFYLLLQLEGLASRVRKYSGELRHQFPDERAHPQRELLRQRLDSNIFVQLLVGARERRQGTVGWLNRTAAWITIAGLPLIVLFVVQVVFLPYHDWRVTWWHRMCVIIDLGLIWYFWRRLAAIEDRTRSAVRAGLLTQRVGVRWLAALYRRGVARHWRAQIKPWAERRLPWAVRVVLVRSPQVLSLLVLVFTGLIFVFPTEFALRQLGSLARPKDDGTVARG